MTDEVELCEKEHVHDGIIEDVKKLMPSEEIIYDIAELFKVFGDSTRTKILTALFESEMCVCDIGRILGMTKSAISHQLRILRQSKFKKSFSLILLIRFLLQLTKTKESFASQF